MKLQDYTIDYLESLNEEFFKNLPEIEQQKLLDDLDAKHVEIYQKILNKELTTYDENQFLYNPSRVGNSEKKIELLIKFPDIFMDYHFLELSNYYRNTQANIHKLEVDLNGKERKIIDDHLASLDMQRLEFFFTDWINKVIKNDSLHKEQNKLKNEIKKETKNQIRDYESDLSKNFKTLNTNYSLESSYTMLILHSKFVYLLCIRIIETFNTINNFHKLILNNTEIRFTQMSLVHILIRHYSPLSKISEHNIKKSNHELDFPPEHIHLQLEKIFSDIDTSSVVKNINLFENLNDKKKIQINFQFKGITYRVWVSLNQNKNEKGKIPFKEIETFHPLDNEDDLNTMKLNFKKEKINDELYLYVPNTN